MDLFEHLDFSFSRVSRVARRGDDIFFVPSPASSSSIVIIAHSEIL
jgi:hypothetical protein